MNNVARIYTDINQRVLQNKSLCTWSLQRQHLAKVSLFSAQLALISTKQKVDSLGFTLILLQYFECPIQSTMSCVCAPLTIQTQKTFFAKDHSQANSTKFIMIQKTKRIYHHFDSAHLNSRFIVILIKWFNYKKNSFEVSNFMWILTISLNFLSSATRACISTQISN